MVHLPNRRLRHDGVCVVHTDPISAKVFQNIFFSGQSAGKEKKDTTSASLPEAQLIAYYLRETP